MDYIDREIANLDKEIALNSSLSEYTVLSTEKYNAQMRKEQIR